MTMSVQEAERVARAGAAALQAGDSAEARRRFEELVAAGQANAQVWFLLAWACRAGGDTDAEERALDEVLALDSRNLRALVLKGDCRRKAGDDRGATSFYGTAVRLAAQRPDVPADLRAEVDRAAAAADEIAGRYREQLESVLESKGLAPAHRSPRFQQSIEILAGEKQIYLQQPTAYYFPGLPHIQFYERERFEWAEEVEAATGAMREELSALLEEEGLFRPYLEAAKDRPRYDFHGLLGNPEWSTLYLWENGGPVERNVERCPRTFAALAGVPMPHITTRAPSILFSLLKAGARIPAHHGMINTRLICHLPLIVPENCGFRCGNEIRQWEEGKLLIFDDTIEHEAWNDSDRDRVVLIFDVWRPELDEDERRAVTALFEAVDSYASPAG